MGVGSGDGGGRTIPPFAVGSLRAGPITAAMGFQEYSNRREKKMKFVPRRGELELVLSRIDVEQLLNATYLMEMVPRNLPDHAAGEELIEAVGTIRAFLAVEGKKHLDEHGALKRSAMRKAADAAIDGEGGGGVNG